MRPRMDSHAGAFSWAGNMQRMNKRPPSLIDVANQVSRSMLITDPISPMGWAVARDENGKPLYMVAVVFGPENIERMDRSLEKIRPKLKAVNDSDLGL